MERERPIQAFVPVEYWTVDADLAKHPADDLAGYFRARLVAIGKDEASLPNAGRAQAVCGRSTGPVLAVYSVRSKILALMRRQC